MSLDNLTALLAPCAYSCFVESQVNSSCSAINQTCICGDEAFTTQATACVATKCTIKEMLSTRNVTLSLCGVHPHVNQSYEPVVIVFIVLTAITFCLRLLARLQFTSLSLWWDDFVISIAMLSTLAVTVSTLRCMDQFRPEAQPPPLTLFIVKPLGLGVDMWAVSPKNITSMFKGLYVESSIYTSARYLVRASILLFYLRIFQPSKARPFILGTLVFVGMEGIAFLLPTIFQCRPISYFWTQWDGEHVGRCNNVQAITMSSIIIGIVCDVWMILLPLPLVYQLQLPWRKKVQVSIVFALGIAVTAISIARLPAIIKLRKTTNPTADYVHITLLSALENDVAVICACLPSIRPLIKPVFTKIGSQISGSRSSSGSNTRATATQKSLVKPGLNDSTSNHDDGDRPNIVVTTTTQRRDSPYDLENDVPLDGLDLGTTANGAVRAQAWA